MRLTMPHSFWRSNCSALIFGFNDSNFAKLHRLFPKQLYRTQRLVVLLNKPAKPVNTSQPTSSDIVNQDPDSQIALFVAPMAKIPFLLRGYASAEPESSTSVHRAFIWIVGLTVSLVSLGALRAFEFFDWLSKTTLAKNTPIVDLEHNLGQNGIPWSVESTPYPASGMFNSGTCNTKSFAGTSEHLPAAFTSPTTYCWRSTKGSPGLTTKYNRVGEIKANAFDPLMSLFYQSPLHTVNASLNCPHFNQGNNQLCLICWLNSPEQWVFGPNLGPLDRSIFACLDKLANMGLIQRSRDAASGLMMASALLSRPSGSKADLTSCLDSTTRTARRHVLLRSACVSSPTACSDNTQTTISPRKRLSSSDRLDHVSPAQSFSKIARSSGDGAPSASPSDVYSRSSFKSEAPAVDVPRTALHFTSYNDALRNSASKPVFYIHQSDVETSPISSPNLSKRLTSASTEQLCLSANRVLSKALEILGSKASAQIPTNPNNISSTSVSPSSCRKAVLSCAGTSRSGSTNSHLSSSHDSLQSLLSDGFEYDELYRSNSHLMDSSGGILLLDPEEEERLQQEEEAQLMHLLSTLTSLLDRKVGEASLLELTQPSTDSTIPTVSPAKATNSGQGQANVPFSDLFQSASDITEDLQHLEEVLDKLRYKLQANQIELEQAEDKLDYVWHLHDRLDGSEASSISYDCSSTGSCASLTSEFATRNPATVNPLVALESPVVRDTADDRPVTTDQQIPCNSQVLVPTYFPSTESLCTSFTSHHTTATVSVERDPLSQSVTDSACGQSISPYSYTMTTSVPDARIACEAHFRDESLVQGSNTLDRPRRSVRPHSRWSYASHRRSAYHTDRALKLVDSDRVSDLEDPIDPDGFLHPELTFDNDGAIDWSKSSEVMR